MDVRQESKRNTRGKRQQTLLITLSSVDDYNSISTGSQKEMGGCFEEAAEEWARTWDKSKQWKYPVHLKVTLDKRTHQKYRTNFFFFTHSLLVCGPARRP